MVKYKSTNKTDKALDGDGDDDDDDRSPDFGAGLGSIMTAEVRRPRAGALAAIALSWVLSTGALRRAG
jgi:hypothetical protein